MFWIESKKLCRHHKCCIDDDCMRSCQDWKRLDESGKSLCTFIDSNAIMESNDKPTKDNNKTPGYMYLLDDDIIVMIVIAFDILAIFGTVSFCMELYFPAIVCLMGIITIIYGIIVSLKNIE